MIFVEHLKLKSNPVGVTFLKDSSNLPEKVRIPSKMGIRVTLCQAISWARLYGWRVFVSKKDINCIPAGLAFNLLKSEKISNQEALSKLMVEVGWVKPEVADRQRWNIIEEEIAGVLLEPLTKASRNPQVVLVYADPSQTARLIQAYTYMEGEPVFSTLTGRVACSDYIIAPYISGKAVITVPGAGDRIFSGTQDTELVFSFPYEKISALEKGLKEAGAKIGTSRYPFPPYTLMEVRFPPVYQKLAEELGIK